MIAYTLAFILIFLLDFEATVEFPIVLVQLILIAIAGFPGKSVGGTLGGALYGGLGVLLGVSEIRLKMADFSFNFLKIVLVLLSISFSS